MNTFSEYEAAALSTAIYPGQGGPLGLMYVSLKGAGEAGEFCEHLCSTPAPDLLAKEIGDELWYCAAKARELGTSLTELFGETMNLTDTFVVPEIDFLGLRGAQYAGAFAEQVGKAIRDDSYSTHDWSLTDDRRELLIQLLEAHVRHLATKAEALGTTLSEIAAENIAKLQSRKERGVLGGSGDNR